MCTWLDIHSTAHYIKMLFFGHRFHKPARVERWTVCTCTLCTVALLHQMAVICWLRAAHTDCSRRANQEQSLVGQRVPMSLLRWWSQLASWHSMIIWRLIHALGSLYNVQTSTSTASSLVALHWTAERLNRTLLSSIKVSYLRENAHRLHERCVNY